MTDIRTQVDFTIIRYANCWEDADVLLQSLQMPSQSKICCIASAGDNALALLSTNPAAVDAFDISLPQLYVTELKKWAFAALTYEEVLQLLGVTTATEKTKLLLLQNLLPALSDEAATYWKKNEKLISKGIIHAGKFEHYFYLFRRYFLPLVHSRSTVQQLLEPKTDGEQQQFYQASWNNRRWQWLMAFFFSKKIMGRYGRDPQFLKQVQVPVSQFIRQKAALHLQSAHCTHNAFLQMIFTGNYQHSRPFYLRRENFEVIKSNIDKLNIVQADATAIIKMQSYDAYCLSNIFEYMPQEQFEQLAKEWQPYLLPKAKIAFWNLMATRSFAETEADKYLKITPNEQLIKSDNGFFYSRFCLEERS